MKRILFLFFVAVLLKQISAAGFSSNSFVVQGSTDSSSYNNFIRELSINGSTLQQIDLPNQRIGAASGAPYTDITGTLLLVRMWNDGPSFNEHVCYVHAMDSRGQIVDVTSATLAGGNLFTSVALDGQDVWASAGISVLYMKRGDTSATTANIVAGEGFNSMARLQLIGSRLYIASDNLLKFMDPVVTTVSSTLTTLTGVQRLNFFQFLTPDTLYIWDNNNNIIKYSVNVAQNSASELYRVAIQRSLDLGESFLNFHVLEVDGVTYVFLFFSTNLGSTIRRYTDDGAFSNLVTIYQGADKLRQGGPSPKLTCTDGFLNQDESDIDCGGTTCNACANDKTCSVDSDCSSGYCTSGKKCADPLCTDLVKNGKETDVDCGGLDCGACEINQKCSANSDCKSNRCVSSVCAASCTDGLLNNGESDIDCGGLNCNPCVDGKNCQTGGDCESAYCNPNSQCSIESCDDSFLNQNETDVDCGGSICPKCDVDKTCDVAADCTGGYCNPSKKCATPSCSDGLLNQDETDIDCGGATCNKCAIDKACKISSDCESNTCTGNVCVNAPVALPVSVPVSNTPSSTTPSSTPVKRVSAGAVVEMSLVLLLSVIIA